MKELNLGVTAAEVQIEDHFALVEGVNPESILKSMKVGDFLILDLDKRIFFMEILVVTRSKIVIAKIVEKKNKSIFDQVDFCGSVDQSLVPPYLWFDV